MSTNGKNSRSKILAVITVAVVAGAILFTAVIEPQLKRREHRLGQMHKLQLDLAKMRGDLLIKDRIDSVYAQVKPLIANNGTDQQEISLFTRELSDIYSRLNVKIRSVKILPVADEEFYKRLSIKIEMAGNIRSILNFVVAIETNTSPVRIERFELKSQEIVDNVHASFLITKVVGEPEDKVS